MEKLGRVNDVGESIFYGATSINNILFELDAKAGDIVVFSKWRTNTKIILNHIGFTYENTNILQSKRKLSEIYSFVNAENTNRFGDLNEHVYSYLSSKFAEEIPLNEEYKYKLTIAIWRKFTVGNLLHGILYPSVAMYGNSDNIALKAAHVDKLSFVNSTFIEVTAQEIQKNQFQTKIIDTATSIGENEKLVWSGRNFQWKLTNQNDQLTFAVEQGQWIVRDSQGMEVDPC
ncbi:MAG: hypothetical protein M1365_00165 [Actinobacteria bacterium]|nr:hypothetical protein [Actinomycetota bacterium]